MKQLFITTLLLTMSFHTFAFKGTISSSNYQVNASGDCQVIAPYAYTIQDVAPALGVPNQRNTGVDLCKQLGLFPTTGLTAVDSTLGVRFYRHTSDSSTTNCAFRSSGVANGSMTCQSSASYSAAQ